MTNATKFKILCKSFGGTKWLFTDELTYEEALSICEVHNWMFTDGGYIWDMIIEEDD